MKEILDLKYSNYEETLVDIYLQFVYFCGFHCKFVKYMI